MELSPEAPIPARLRAAVQASWHQLPAKFHRDFTSRYHSASVSLSFFNAKKMQRLNRDTRGKDRPTDVLAFSQLEGQLPPRGALHLGDIIICLAVARGQAQDYEAPLSEELCRLTVHGFLHLMGYDHEKSDLEARRMFRLQNLILSKLLSNSGNRVLLRRSRRGVKRRQKNK